MIDATCDAYDMAFVLFAHAWMFRLNGDPSILQSALNTLAALDDVLAHPNGLGWRALEGHDGAREQNPHMHLMEAAVELAAATGHELFFDLAVNINKFFRRKLYNGKYDCLHEFFLSDWNGLDPEKGHIVEPGHMLEWSWILSRAERLLGLEASDPVKMLYHHALRVGEVSSTGLILDQVDRTGQVISGGYRSWPQTEALKAHLSAYEMGDQLALGRAKRSLDNLLDRYLNCNPRGCWVDQLDGNLLPSAHKIPSTTFYHIFLAFSEVERIRKCMLLDPI